MPDLKQSEKTEREMLVTAAAGMDISAADAAVNVELGKRADALAAGWQSLMKRRPKLQRSHSWLGHFVTFRQR